MLSKLFMGFFFANKKTTVNKQAYDLLDLVLRS